MLPTEGEFLIRKKVMITWRRSSVFRFFCPEDFVFSLGSGCSDGFFVLSHVIMDGLLEDNLWW